MEAKFDILRKFRTCDIADALQAEGIQDGGFIADINMLSPGFKVDGIIAAGPAYTVKFLSNDSPKPVNGAVNGNTKPKHWVDSATKGCIIVVEQADGSNTAIMGGVISARAHAIGVSGVVVDGRVRDLEEHRAVGLPVFARNTSVLCPASRNIATDIPIKVGGQNINPGDCIVADSDGIVHFDPSLLDKVIEGVPNILKVENNVRDAVLDGISLVEAHKIYKPWLYA